MKYFPRATALAFVLFLDCIRPEFRPSVRHDGKGYADRNFYSKYFPPRGKRFYFRLGERLLYMYVRYREESARLFLELHL